MNLAMGNKNVIVGLLVIIVYFSMTLFIDRMGALHQFHNKAAAIVIDTKGYEDLLDDEVIEIKRGPAYRKGGLYFTNYTPASYVAVPNSQRDAGINMRLYAWIFALFNIIIGFIVGIQTGADRKLREWASWLALAGVILYPVRDAVFFWCRRFIVRAPSSVVYPIKWVGGVTMFAALLLSLIVFVQGARKEAVK